MNSFTRWLFLSSLLMFIWLDLNVDDAQAGLVRIRRDRKILVKPISISTIIGSEEVQHRNNQRQKLIDKLKQVGGRRRRETKDAFRYFYEFLVDKGLNRICKLFREAQLEEVLTSVGTFTLFAPTDNAFAFLEGKVLEELENDTTKLQGFLLYHLAPGPLTTIEMKDDSTINSAQGAPLRFNTYENGDVVTVSGSQILESDLKNGDIIVHVIDHVLYPPPTNNIPNEIRANYNTMYRLLEVADLTHILSDKSFTCFVPSDQAFRILPPTVRNAIYTNTTLLQRILLNHMIPGTFFRAGLPVGFSLQPLDGSPLVFSTKRGLILVNGIPIVIPDVIATNGVMHVINRVLLPNDVLEDCKCLTPAAMATTTVKPDDEPGLPIDEKYEERYYPEMPDKETTTLANEKLETGPPLIPTIPLPDQTDKPDVECDKPGPDCSDKPDNKPDEEKPKDDDKPDKTKDEPKRDEKESDQETPKDDKPYDETPKDDNIKENSDEGKTKDNKPNQEEPKDDKLDPKEDKPDQEEPKDDKLDPKEDKPDQEEPKEVKPDQEEPKEGKPDQEEPKEDKPDQEEPKEDKPDQEEPKEDKHDQEESKKDKPDDEKPQDKTYYETPDSKPSCPDDVECPDQRPPFEQTPECPDEVDCPGPQTSPKGPLCPDGFDCPEPKPDYEPDCLEGTNCPESKPIETTKCNEGDCSEKTPDAQTPCPEGADCPDVKPSTEVPDVKIQCFGPDCTSERQKPTCPDENCPEAEPNLEKPEPEPICLGPNCPSNPEKPEDVVPEDCPGGVCPTITPLDASSTQKPSSFESRPQKVEPTLPTTIDPNFEPTGTNTIKATSLKTKGPFDLFDDIVNSEPTEATKPDFTEPQTSEGTLSTVRSTELSAVTESSTPTQINTEKSTEPSLNTERSTEPSAPSEKITKSSLGTVKPTESSVGTEKPTEVSAETEKPTESSEPTEKLPESSPGTENPTEASEGNEKTTELTEPKEPTSTSASTDKSTEPTSTSAPTDKSTEPTSTSFSTDKSTEPTLTSTSTDKPTEPSVTSASTDKPTEPPVTTISTDKPTETSVTTISTDKPTETSVTTISTDKPTETSVTTFSTDKPTEPSVTTDSTDKPTEPSVTTVSTDKPTEPSVTTIYTDKPSVSTVTSTSTEKPTEPSVTTVSTDKPTELSVTTISTDKPTELSVTTISTDKPTEPSVTTISTDKPTEPSVTTVSTDKPTEPSVTTVSTDKPTEPSVTTVSTDKPTEPSVTTVSTDKPTEPSETTVSTDKPTEPSLTSLSTYKSTEPTDTTEKPATQPSPENDNTEAPNDKISPDVNERRPPTSADPELPITTATPKLAVKQSERPEIEIIPTIPPKQIEEPITEPQVPEEQPVPQIPELTCPDNGKRKPTTDVVDFLGQPNLILNQKPVTFKIVLRLFDTAGLTSILRRRVPYTLCIPTDEAFSSMPKENINKLQTDLVKLRRILLFHIISSQLPNYSLRDNSVIKTYQGSPIIINVLNRGKLVLIGGAPVIGFRKSPFGQVYVISRPLSRLPQENVLRALRERPNLNQFLNFIQSCSLGKSLQGKGPYTVFAPTNEAFRQLPDETLNTLRSNKRALERLLNNHVVYGAQFLAGVTRDRSVPTIQQGRLQFHRLQDGVTINGALIIEPDIATGNGVVHVVNKVLFPKPENEPIEYAPVTKPRNQLLDHLSRGLGVDKFIDFLTESGIMSQIEDGRSYTIFAPTDSAIEALPPTLSRTLQTDVNQMLPIIKYHIVPSAIQFNQITDEMTLSTLLPNKNVRFNYYHNDTVLTVSGAPVGPVRMMVGVTLCVVNKVLYPPIGDITKTVSKSPILQDFTKALRVTGLDEELAESGPYTLFAPTEAAFRYLPKAEFLSIFNDPVKLRDLVSKHIIRGTLFSAGVSDGMTTRALNGGETTLTLKPQCIVVNGVNVLYSDITATNGVVHVLDHLL